MKTITIKFDVTTREHELLVAAKADQPHPSRIKAMLLADAARVLRGMIDTVQQERTASFKKLQAAGVLTTPSKASKRPTSQPSQTGNTQMRTE